MFLMQISLTGLFENLAFASPLMLLILLPVGFIASAWVTNSMFDYIRPNLDEITVVDQVGTFLILTTIFASYCYFITSFFPE